MKALATILILVLFGAGAARASDKSRTFEAAPAEVFSAAVKSAQKNWTVTNTDRESMTLSFTTGTSLRTWGMDCAVRIEPDGTGAKVTMHTQKKMQVYAWKVGDSIADKFFKGIEQELASAHTAPAKDSPAPPPVLQPAEAH